MPLRKALFAALLFFYLDDASAVEFEKLGSAVEKVLGTKKAFKITVNLKGKKTDVFYAKDGSGKASRFAVIQKGIYEPNCTHTWVVGMDKSAKVNQIRVVEMSCPHAFPTNSASFLDQYKGKGPTEAKALKGDINTIAKATGSSDLTTDAVSTSILVVDKLRKKL